MTCNLQKLKAPMKMLPSKTKKEVQAFPGIINYLGKSSPSIADVCESFRKLTSGETEWTWNATYHKIFDKANSTIKEDACMKFYDETKSLYIETDASGVGLEAAIVHIRSSTSCCRDEVPDISILRPTAFVSKRLSSSEKKIQQHTKKCIRHIQKFHYYCFVREVSIITEQKPLVVLFKTDIAILSETAKDSTQNTPIQSHIYKPGQNLFIADYLSNKTTR